MDRKQVAAKFGKFLIVVVGLTIVISTRAVALEDTPAVAAMQLVQSWTRHRGSDSGLLKRYEEIYSPEVFEFCYELHSAEVKRLGACLNRQEHGKKKIIRRAKKQLGDQYLALALHQECLESYPVYGVNRVGQCVGTRLQLRKKVGSIAIEDLIYRKCEDKWRHSGSMAIDNCCSHEARYYNENGKLRSP